MTKQTKHIGKQTQLIFEKYVGKLFVRLIEHLEMFGGNKHTGKKKPVYSALHEGRFAISEEMSS